MSKLLSARALTLMLSLGAAFAVSIASPAPAQARAEFKLKVDNARSRVGEATTVTVTVTPAAGFHVNADYPNKIKDLAVDGAKLPASSVDGAVKGEQLTFTVPVTPERAGKHTLTGQIRFSVCNDSSCQVKKLSLDATVVGT